MALFAHASHPGDACEASRAPICSCKRYSWSCLQTPLTVLLAIPTSSPAGSPPPQCRAAPAFAPGSPGSGSPCPWGGGERRGLHSPGPLPHPELPLLFPRLCHRQFWDHLPISVACSLKLIICQCELGRDCAGLAGDQNLPSFQLHPARPPPCSRSSPAATPEGWGMRCCVSEGKKSAQQIKPTLPHGRDGSVCCTDAAMEQEDARARHLPWLSRKLGTHRG